ncbi:MAG: glycoside hydrolase family 20 zincin-like fold domain-containing protein [Candidatus Hydrogenedentota bacterium]
MTPALTALLVLVNLGPAPISQMHLDGPAEEFRFEDTTRVVLAPGTPGNRADAIRDSLAALDAPPAIVRYEGDIPDDALVVGVYNTHPAFERRALRRLAKETAALASGGFRLRTRAGTLAICGRDTAGVYHGLNRLRALIAQHGAQLPALDLEEAPRRETRGVVLYDLPDDTIVNALAKHLCNLVIFDHPDFAAGARLDAWAHVFEMLRRRGMTPIPTLRTLSGAEPFLARHPEAAEGRIHSETHTLTGEEFVSLTKRNVLHTAESPIRVRCDALETCTRGTDFGIEPGHTAPPYAADHSPWYLYRISTGGIPEGARVTVTYSHVPPGTDALCPHSGEAHAALAQNARRLADALAPRFVYLGHARVTRLREDMRCRRSVQDDAAAFAESVRAVAAAFADTATTPRLLLRDDRLRDAEPAPFNIGRTLPRDLTVDRIHYGGRPDSNAILAVDNPIRTYEAVRDDAAPCAGLLIDTGASPTAATHAMLDLAWHGVDTARAWPLGLNDYFNVQLWAPTFDEQRDAVMTHLDAAFRTGEQPPQALRAAFEALVQRIEAQLPEDDTALDTVHALYNNLLRYAEIEAAFAAGDRNDALDAVSGLVEAQAAIDPTVTEERSARIVETADKQRLFVPASILFGRPLLAWRNAAGGVPGPVAEVPVAPAFQDAPGEVTATIAFQAPADVVRVDYTTVGAKTVTCAYEDGSAFTRLRTWEDAGGYVRGPILLRQPLTTGRLRLVAQSVGTRAVLREIRIFAKVPEPTLVVSRQPPASRATGGGVARGFRIDEERFAEAPTVVRAHRTPEELVLTVTAWEPRMHALFAEEAPHDSPLWEQESIEVRVAPLDDQPQRYLVNARGARYDSRRGDAAWDGDWEGTTQQRDDAWEAVLTLPFSTLGQHPNPGDTWRIHFVRHRINATNEHSAWPEAEPPGNPHTFRGTLRFQ